MALKSLKAIGLMSGTSLDGIDVALLDSDGQNIQKFGASFFRPYSHEEREIIEQSTQAALKWNFDGPPPNIFAQAQNIVDAAHIQAAQSFIEENNLQIDEIDLIGYHGQTILHRPPQNDENGQTLQLGDGARIAQAFGVDTVFDFRSNDMTKGGQGAPLAPVYHKALVENAELSGTTGVLNVGGVSNITVLSSGGNMVATDCGPGNGPLDSWVAKHKAGDYDKDGKYSLAGTPDIALIESWLKRAFFQKPVPKSADRWDFDVLDEMRDLSLQDGAATLVAFAAMAVKNTLRNVDQPVDNIIVCGGGRHNPAFMAALDEQGLGQIKSAENLGWQGDDIEAQAFAFLAVRHLNGLPLSYPSTTGVKRAVSGGRIAKASPAS